MRIIVTRNTFIGGRLVEASPTPLDVEDAVGKQLLALGKAVSVETPAETPVESAPVVPAPKEEKPRAKGK